MNAIRRFPSQLSRISPFSMTGDVLSLLASCFRRFCHTLVCRYWHNPHAFWHSLCAENVLTAGADPGIFYWGGGPNFGSERTELFCGKLLLPTPAPPATSSGCMHVIIPWPLTVYLHSTRKGCTLATSSSCASSNKDCTDFVNIIGGYPKTITFLNIPGIWLTGKMQSAVHWKNQLVKKWNTILSM